MKNHLTASKIPVNLPSSKILKQKRYSKSPAIKHLESLILEAKKLRYPSIPSDYIAAVKYRDDTANGLTKCGIDFLKVKGHQAERISTTGRPIDRTKTFTDVLGHQRTIGRIEWIPGTSTKGSADISATIDGRSVKIEVKIGPDRMSQAQRDYERSIVTSGGIYYIAKDFATFLTWFNLNFTEL